MARPTKSSRFRSQFAQRLETQRMRTGMSQEEFASSLGLKGETYRRYERGETEPNLDILAKLRKIVKINLNHLIAGEPDLVIETDHTTSQKAHKTG